MSKIVSVAIILLVFLALLKLLSTLVQNLGEAKSVPPLRILYIKKTLSLSLFVLCLMIIFLSLGIQYAQVSLFLSSVFAVIGVAFFAQWSILSNITASLVIFFGFPYRIGDHIKVVDKDDDLSGVIEEITLFHVLIRRNNSDLVTYPNSLILQKAVIKCAEEPAAEAPPTAAEIPEQSAKTLPSSVER